LDARDSEIAELRLSLEEADARQQIVLEQTVKAHEDKVAKLQWRLAQTTSQAKSQAETLENTIEMLKNAQTNPEVSINLAFRFYA